MASLIPRMTHTSAAGSPSKSLMTTTWRWRSGSRARWRDTFLAVWRATMRSSASSVHGAGGDDHPPAALNRSGGTAGSSMRSVGVSRRSRTPAVRARLTTMRNSHVFSDDRPSNRSMPRTTPSQVSCTTSSATARLGTNVDASRSRGAW